MAGKPAKKTPSKTSGTAKGRKGASKNSGNSGAKRSTKSAASKGAAKKAAKTVRKPLTDKERELREANAIANSEKKRKPLRRPKKSSTASQTIGLLDAVVEGMKERKAKNIMMLDLRKIENRVTDYFVICDADSRIHVNSIADSVEETVLKLTNEKAYHTEGQQNGEWILIDYINVVAHIFLKETREHYNIEGLWGDAEITLINN